MLISVATRIVFETSVHWGQRLSRLITFRVFRLFRLSASEPSNCLHCDLRVPSDPRVPSVPSPFSQGRYMCVVFVVSLSMFRAVVSSFSFFLCSVSYLQSYMTYSFVTACNRKLFIVTLFPQSVDW